MADRVWKAIYPYVFGCSKQLWQNKFFDPSTPSMRKVNNGEKKKGGEKKKWHLKWPLTLLPVNNPNAD